MGVKSIIQELKPDQSNIDDIASRIIKRQAFQIASAVTRVHVQNMTKDLENYRLVSKRRADHS